MRQTRAPLVFRLAFRFEAACLRAVQRLEGALGTAALHVLTPRELSALTRDLYAASEPSAAEGLHPWEADWFAQALPQEPGKILVGGAGQGREARHLRRLGHSVFGFDPVMKFVRQAARDSGASVVRGSYEALVTPQSASERAFAGWVEANAPYDAVLLGWVSFTHLPDRKTRQALLSRLAKLCPSGPILLSFWLSSEGRGQNHPRGRVWSGAGRLTSKLRPDFVPPEPGDLFTHRGFVHLFSEGELEELAEAASLTLDPRGARGSVGTCPHATLRHCFPLAAG